MLRPTIAPKPGYNGARRTRKWLDLRDWLIALTALALGGCVSLEEQELALTAIRDEVRALGAHLQEIETSVQALAGQAESVQGTVDARLDAIDLVLARPIEVPAAVCEFPEMPKAAPESVECETPVETITQNGTEKMVVGAVEHVRIMPPGVTLTARIDSGADSSSLSAANMVFLERDGDDWVRFDLMASGEVHTIERRVLRFVRVFQQSDATGVRRPVVRLRIQFGDILGLFEFNLSDRRHLEHPVILGRNLLVDLVVVDVAKKFTRPLPDPGG